MTDIYTKRIDGKKAGPVWPFVLAATIIAAVGGTLALLNGIANGRAGYLPEPMLARVVGLGFGMAMLLWLIVFFVCKLAVKQGIGWVSFVLFWIAASGPTLAWLSLIFSGLIES
jgi:hypothetical protein